MRADPKANVRGRFEGVTNIVRFNPGYFIASSLFVLGAVLFLIFSFDRLPATLMWMTAVGTSLAFWWLVASLVVSWQIYDGSSLYEWSWLPSAIIENAEVVSAAHAGFDEVSGSLVKRFPEKQIMVLDFYDPDRMTEKSIQRARRICSPVPGTIPVGRLRWELPVTPDLILFILSAHEWRTHAERVDILASARESLSESGHVIVIEHLRDLSNFMAFGPGFLHFHSERTWQNAWSDANLVETARFRITPFLSGFVLKPTKVDD